ncbi:hypothetical protein D3C80_2180720 [compost metagenome]
MTIYRFDTRKLIPHQLQQGREDVVVAGVISIACQRGLPVGGLEFLTLDDYQRYQALFIHRVITTMGVQSGVATFV